MNEKESKSKEEILSEIEKLMSYGREDANIMNPALLKYMDKESLLSIRDKLVERVGKLSDKDKEWLQQFKKYE